MYTETMTLEEMNKEFERDYEIINRSELYYRTHDKGIKAARRQGAKYPFYAFGEKTVNGNKYLSIYIFTNRKAAFDNNIGGIYVALIYRGGKLNALLPISDGVMLITNHLLERYSERTGYAKTGIERVRHFIISQGGFFLNKDFKHPDSEKAVMYSCKEGAIFGEIDSHRNILAKTFIDVESMKGGYKGVLDDGFNEKLDNNMFGILARAEKRKGIMYQLDLIQKR